MAYFIREELVGFAETVRNYPEPGMAMIGLLMIAAAHQARGHGARRLGAILDSGKAAGVNTVFLCYASSNEGARRFWERADFIPTGDVDHSDDLDLVAMERHVQPPPGRTLAHAKCEWARSSTEDWPKAGVQRTLDVGHGPLITGGHARKERVWGILLVAVQLDEDLPDVLGLLEVDVCLRSVVE